MSAARFLLSAATCLAAVGMATSGCGAILGIEPGTDIVDGGSETSTSLQPSGTCTTACASAPPAGWDGPFAYAETRGGPPAPLPAACSGAYPNVVYDGFSSLVAPPASCSCSCGSPAGLTCAPPVVNFFSDPACATSCGGKNQSLQATCTTFDLTGCAGTHATVGASLAKGGACEPKPASTTVPPAWTASHRLCGLATPSMGACDEGKLCLPTPSLPQAPGTLCVAKAGDAECPATYAVKHLASKAFLDGRACSACTCGAPTGATCSVASATGYDKAACTGGSKALVVPQACIALGSQFGVTTGAPTLASAGSCEPAGGEPMGAAEPTTSTTICCNE